MSAPTISFPTLTVESNTLYSAVQEKPPVTEPRPYFYLQSRAALNAKFTALTSSGSEYSPFDALSWLEMQARFSHQVKCLSKLGTSFFIYKGQFFTTKKYLGAIFNWSEKKVRYQLHKWQQQGLILVIAIKNNANYAIGSIIHCQRIAQYDPRLALKPKEAYLQLNAAKSSSSNNLLSLPGSQDSEQRPVIDKQHTPALLELQSQGATDQDCKKRVTVSKSEFKNSFSPMAQKILTPNRGSSFSHIKANKSPLGADVLYKNIINLKINYKGTDLQNQVIRNQDRLIKKLLTEKQELAQKSRQKVVYFKNLLEEKKQQIPKRRPSWDWSFQLLPEFKALETRLAQFGFNKRQINGIWWRYTQKSRTDSAPDPTRLALLTDYIDYTMLRQSLGRVDDARRFLLSALKRGFDLSGLAELRKQAKTEQQKQLEREEADRLEMQQQQVAREQKVLDRQRDLEKRERWKAWITANPQHPVFEQTLQRFKTSNSFCYSLLVREARKVGLSDIEFLRLPQYSTTAHLSGLYGEIDVLINNFSVTQNKIDIERIKLKGRVNKTVDTNSKSWGGVLN